MRYVFNYPQVAVCGPKILHQVRQFVISVVQLWLKYDSSYRFEMHDYWHSISLVDLCKVQMYSLWSNLLCPVTNAPEVTTRYPICSSALSKLKAAQLYSTRRFFSSRYSGTVPDFSDKTRNSFKGSPSTVQLQKIINLHSRIKRTKIPLLDALFLHHHFLCYYSS